MNMDHFDKDTWYLHRKLFHRFMKYAKYFRKATEGLDSYIAALAEENSVAAKCKEKEVTCDVHMCFSHVMCTCDSHMWCSHVQDTKAKPIHVISVVSSSSDEVSEDEVEFITVSGEETPKEDGDDEPGTETKSADSDNGDERSDDEPGIESNSADSDNGDEGSDDEDQEEEEEEEEDEDKSESVSDDDDEGGDDEDQEEEEEEKEEDQHEEEEDDK